MARSRVKRETGFYWVRNRRHWTVMYVYSVFSEDPKPRDGESLANYKSRPVRLLWMAKFPAAPEFDGPLFIAERLMDAVFRMEEPGDGEE
ncbi:MAG: hypothetical protein GY788_20960 [bacterium]|nr:hypothetical protein [bacterium]